MWSSCCILSLLLAQRNEADALPAAVGTLFGCCYLSQCMMGCFICDIGCHDGCWQRHNYNWKPIPQMKRSDIVLGMVCPLCCMSAFYHFGYQCAESYRSSHASSSYVSQPEIQVFETEEASEGDEEYQQESRRMRRLLSSDDCGHFRRLCSRIHEQKNKLHEHHWFLKLSRDHHF